jgi:hypothetical protein
MTEAMRAQAIAGINPANETPMSSPESKSLHVNLAEFLDRYRFGAVEFDEDVGAAPRAYRA